MILGENVELENAIVLILAGQKCSAEDLLSTLAKQHMSPTIQGVYRALTKLQEEKVVIKEKRMYAIRIPWILELTETVHAMEDTYLQGTYMNQMLPDAHCKKRVTKYNNIFPFIDTWTKILLAMAQKSKSGIALWYTPHTWYALTHTKEWSQFKTRFLHLIDRQYTVVGSQQFADHYLNALTNRPQQENSYFAPPDECGEIDRSLYTAVIDDFVLTIKFDDRTTENIETLFSHIHSEDDIHVMDVFSAFTGKCKITMTIREDAKRARKIRKKFESFFGPLERKKSV